MRLKIASRKSDLARLQSYRVAQALKKISPSIEIEFQFRESLGDKNLNDPLWKSPEKGVFTEDFYQDLVQGKCDLVVHSWKDLPTLTKSDTQIAATLQRAAPQDMLLFKKSSHARAKEKKELLLLSSSPRRAYNLESFFQEFFPYPVRSTIFESVRGNVQTRVRKLLENSQADGLIVAKAALDRLLTATEEDLAETRHLLQGYLTQLDWMVLPLSLNPTAAAQGALAIEIASHRHDLQELLSQINDPTTFACVNLERDILKSYGGGCHQKIGVHVLQVRGQQHVFLRGQTDSGEILHDQSYQALKISPARPTDFASAKIHWHSGEFAKGCDRRPHPHQISPALDAFYIAKTEGVLMSSLPIEDLKTRYGQFVLWTPGVGSWKALAKQGFWIHGCQEGLGEAIALDIDALFDRPRQWGRLTFASPAASRSSATSSQNLSFPEMQTIETYELQKPQSWPAFEKFENLYWSSPQLFIWALEANPQLAQKQHFCGAGRTFEALSQYLSRRGLANKISLKVHLNPQLSSPGE